MASPDEKDSTQPLGPDPFGHLTWRDTRTPEERQAAESKEWARRKGRGRKDWWKKHLPDPQDGLG